MKLEIDRPGRLEAWLKDPRPAVFQGQDLVAASAQIAARDLRGCAFLGCRMDEALAAAAVAAGAIVLPRVEGLPFDPFTPRLYSPETLYDCFDPARPESYRDCFDWAVWASCVDPADRRALAASLDTLLMRRIHDASISDALDDLLDEPVSSGPGAARPRRASAVAVMGGHDEPRSTRGPYAAVAHMALALARAGHFVVTGGGPGLMEAANLGAYAAGFDDPESALGSTLAALAEAPTYRHPRWLASAWSARTALGRPAQPEWGRSLGVPTWFYGHEPPNVFATDVAKYFENHVREEGLLAVALGGVVFARGNAGTVQEIFQDACQNYYRVYGGLKSPMVLLGRDYWDPAGAVASAAGDRRKPAYPLLRALAEEKGFADRLLLTDDLDEAVRFLRERGPVAG
jgi:predicted Rossmann-fold nucleotide-binding protein